MTDFYNEALLAQQSQKVAAIAQAMLNGQLGMIIGSRQLCDLRHHVSPVDHDPDFLPFVGINSETDHLPVDEIRQYWAADALTAKDVEICAAEARYREKALAGCRHLLERFSVAAVAASK